MPANISGTAPATSATARMLRCPTICTLWRSLMTWALPITPTTGFVISGSNLADEPVLLQAEAGEVLRRPRRDFDRCGHVGLPARLVAGPDLGEPASVER